MFRIDRRLVKLSDLKVNKISDDSEVDAQEEPPDEPVSQDTLQREYLSELEEQANEKIAQMLEQANEKVAQMLEDAEEQAKVMVQIACIEAEEERKRGWDEGYADGASEGKHNFDEKLEIKLREADEMVKNVLSEINTEWEKTRNRLEEEAAKLSLEIVRKIIGKAEDDQGSLFKTLIKNALRQVSIDGKIIIRVSPDEYERFFQSGSVVLELDNGAKVNATVLRDVAMNEGDLIIDTDEVTINAGIDSQLKYVELAFERAGVYEPD